MTLLDLIFSAEYINTMPDYIYDILPIAVLFGALAILLLVGMPIAFAIGSAALLTIFIDFPIDKASVLVSQQLANGLNSFRSIGFAFFHHCR
ncbi:hypothetical protein PBPRB1513 [Photobacterium profundum SS9]|uniref:TRAP C4-dicarboxylate transport system permease DctM subunit domain-containing protein n=1 Tax=Photobacterium profundum (strain SS9) TaxID=298386 RepID=Q6LH51_PHOPR|nr:hypothetical protein PBPRB1513 [Photobacterium profundum SS9]